MVAAVVMIVLMAVRMRATMPHASTQYGRANEHDEHAGDEVEPGVELFRDDEPGEQKRHGPEREHADRVCGGDDQPKECCVTRRTALSDEICGHDRLAVSRRERMRHAPEESRTKRCDDH